MSRIPLLLLPGLLLDHRLFRAQIEGLADVAEASVGDLSRYDDVGAVAEAVLAQAPARFALAGLSMGGYVALEIMRRAPERVLRLALMDTQAQADDEVARARRRDQIASVERGEFAAIKEQLVLSWLHPKRHKDADLLRRLHEMADAIGPDGFVREQRTIMSRPDSRPTLAAIACPTLALCGREDGPTPVERHVEMARAIPHATLVVLPQCGHLSPLEAPEAVTVQLRAWLRPAA